VVLVPSVVSIANLSLLVCPETLTPESMVILEPSPVTSNRPEQSDEIVVVAPLTLEQSAA